MKAKISKTNSVLMYPYDVQQLRAECFIADAFLPIVDLVGVFNQTDDAVNGATLVDVADSAKPDYDPTAQSLTEGTPAVIDGVWTQTWVVSALSAEKDAAALLAAQNAKIALLAQTYAQAITQDVSYTTSAGVTKTFQADPVAQNYILLTTTGYALIGSTPDGFYWVSSDNTRVPFTLTDLKGLYGAVLTQGAIAFQRVQDRKVSVRAATNQAEIDAVVW